MPDDGIGLVVRGTWYISHLAYEGWLRRARGGRAVESGVPVVISGVSKETTVAGPTSCAGCRCQSPSLSLLGCSATTGGSKLCRRALFWGHLSGNDLRITAPKTRISDAEYVSARAAEVYAVGTRASRQQSTSARQRPKNGVHGVAGTAAKHARHQR